MGMVESLINDITTCSVRVILKVKLSVRLSLIKDKHNENNINRTSYILCATASKRIVTRRCL